MHKHLTTYFGDSLFVGVTPDFFSCLGKKMDHHFFY